MVLEGINASFTLIEEPGSFIYLAIYLNYSLSLK